MNQLALPGTTNPYRLKVVYDENPESPREWSNLGTMVCFHKRYDLGDEQPKQTPGEYRLAMAERFEPGFEERLEKQIRRLEAKNPPWKHAYGSKAWRERKKELDDYAEARVDKVLAKHIIELPLYLYDHSGITMSTGAFGCPWDSGQVGFIYVEIAAAKVEYGWSVLSSKRRKQLTDYLDSEVKTYDHFLTGQVYGFRVEEWDGEEWVDADDCFGFYGDDAESILDHLPSDMCFTLEKVKDALRNVDSWVYNTPDAAERGEE